MGCGGSPSHPDKGADLLDHARYQDDPVEQEDGDPVGQSGHHGAAPKGQGQDDQRLQQKQRQYRPGAGQHYAKLPGHQAPEDKEKKGGIGAHHQTVPDKLAQQDLASGDRLGQQGISGAGFDLPGDRPHPRKTGNEHGHEGGQVKAHAEQPEPGQLALHGADIGSQVMQSQPEEQEIHTRQEHPGQDYLFPQHFQQGKAGHHQDSLKHLHFHLPSVPRTDPPGSSEPWKG